MSGEEAQATNHVTA